MTAEELVERYEGWLEAAETGDFSDVDFTQYEGNTLPSPVMQLSVYEDEGELKVDEDVVRAYMVDTGDIGYRNLQKLTKGTDVNPIGKESSELLEEVKEEYGSTQDILEEINEREEEFEDFKIEKIVRDRLLEEEIHGRDRIRTMLSEFKKNSNYDPLTDGGQEEEGGENLMTDIDEFKDDLMSAAQDVEDGVRSAEAAYENVLDQYEDTVNDLEELGYDVEQLLMQGSHEVGRINSALEDLGDAATEALNKADDLSDRTDEARNRLGY